MITEKTKIIVTLFHINQGNINLYIITPVPLSAGMAGGLIITPVPLSAGMAGGLMVNMKNILLYFIIYCDLGRLHSINIDSQAC